MTSLYTGSGGNSIITTIQQGSQAQSQRAIVTMGSMVPEIFINFFSSSAFGSIVNSVTGVVGKLSDDKAAEFAAASGAEKDVLVARMQADSQAYQARVSLYRGMFWLQFALLATYVGPLWHSMLVYLDSCPFLPLFTWEHWFELAPHVVGSWHVPVLPGNYCTEE